MWNNISEIWKNYGEILEKFRKNRGNISHKLLKSILLETVKCLR